MLRLEDPIHKGLLPLRVAPPGAVHVLVTIIVLSTDGSNWTLHNRVRFLPATATTWLKTAETVRMGGGTEEAMVFISYSKTILTLESYYSL